MAFTQSTENGAGAGTVCKRSFAGGCWSLACLCGRAVLSILTILIIAGGLLYARLTQGPVLLPGVADLIEARINEGSQDVQVDIGGFALSLGNDGEQSGVRLHGVALTDPAGGVLIGVERVGVQFALVDLIHGRVRPSNVTVFAPDALLIRRPDGGLRFAMGQGRGLRVTPQAIAEGADGGSNPQVFRQFIDTLAGDAEGPEVLSKLERIDIRGARLTFEDLLNGGEWHSQNARIRLDRDEGGLRGSISVAVIDDGTPGAAVRLSIDRRRGAENVQLTANFGRITTKVLSGQLPALAWLSVLEGTVEGRARADVDRQGRLKKLTGVIFAENGRLAGLGEASAFDIAQVGFGVDPEAGTLTLDRVFVSAPALNARLSGIAQLRLDGVQDPESLVGQLDVEYLNLRLPDVFADPLAFDDGQINFRWQTQTNTVTLADTRLANGPLAFHLDGRIMESEAGWITDLRAEGVNMTVQDLIAHWPYVAAVNARTWVRDNIPEANVDNFLAQMRFGAGEPMLSLDFDYSELTSSYIDGMPPIEQARGRGHMTYHALYLEMDEGWVTPPNGEPIALAGSTVDILDFWGEVTPAIVDLVAEGRTADVLALIDEPPLNLVQKLGVDLGQVGGRAQVGAVLDFPLISDLLVADVGADAQAKLTGFSMPFDVDGTTLNVRSNQLELAATTTEMRLAGPVTADGTALQLDWRENYGATPSTRQMVLSGRTTDTLLASFGIEDMPFEGSMPFDLELTQSGSEPPVFRLEGDLTPLTMAMSEMGWEKPEGRDGQLVAEGVLGDELEITAFDLNAAGLRATGGLDLDADGTLQEARFSRLIVPGLADVQGTVRLGEDGGYIVDVTGGSVDLSEVLAGEGEEDGSPRVPLRATFDLDRVAVSEKIAFGRTRGSVELRADGTRNAEIDAWITADGPPVVIRVVPGEEGRTKLGLTTEDAGGLLAALDLYRGASGGHLEVDAVLGGPGEDTVSGSARIEDIVVRSQSTFRDVLRDGGLEDAETAVSSGGLRFRKVWVPFAYQDGEILIEDAIASSPALALKINGTVNEETDTVDMIGVLSPAYVLTGALNEVPVLGSILSGGEGEGILAMTFTLNGSMRDPEFAVNPLSLLAPGFLRRIFTTRNRPVSSNFAEQLQTPDR